MGVGEEELGRRESAGSVVKGCFGFGGIEDGEGDKACAVVVVVGVVVVVVVVGVVAVVVDDDGETVRIGEGRSREKGKEKLGFEIGGWN